MDFWTLRQITEFIGIERAFEEFCGTDPVLGKLDSIYPGPKSEKFEDWYKQYCPAHDDATERFVNLFREKILVAWALRDDKEDDDGITLPPYYWTESIVSLTIDKGRVEGLLLKDRHKHFADCRAVLRREEWERWINGATPDSQHGPQEAVEIPSPAQVTPVEQPKQPSRRKPAELTHERWITRARELKNATKSIKVAQIAQKIWSEEYTRDFAKLPAQNKLVKERKLETIRRVLYERRSEWDIS